MFYECAQSKRIHNGPGEDGCLCGGELLWETRGVPEGVPGTGRGAVALSSPPWKCQEPVT